VTYLLKACLYLFCACIDETTYLSAKTQFRHFLLNVLRKTILRHLKNRKRWEIAGNISRPYDRIPIC